MSSEEELEAAVELYTPQPTSAERRRAASSRGWLPAGSPQLVLRMARQGYDIAKDGSFRNTKKAAKRAAKEKVAR